MTTKSIINKANKLCRESGINVLAIEFQHQINFENENRERVELLIFLCDIYQERRNFAVTLYEPKIDATLLLKKLEVKLLEIKLTKSNANKITYKDEN
jgi:hypothetical protein